MAVIKCKWLHRFLEMRNSPPAMWGRKWWLKKEGRKEGNRGETLVGRHNYEIRPQVCEKRLLK
jgi:hypothetical protein